VGSWRIRLIAFWPHSNVDLEELAVESWLRIVTISGGFA
jgi:hypothetical protein